MSFIKEMIADMRSAQTFMDENPEYSHTSGRLAKEMADGCYGVCSLGALVLSKGYDKKPTLISYQDVYPIAKWSTKDFVINGLPMRGEHVVIRLNDGVLTGGDMTPGEIADYLEGNHDVTELERGTSSSS